MSEKIVIIFLTVILIHQCLFWIYLWQIKEYRIDRFKAGFSWKSILLQFNLVSWYRPKWTVRAILTFGLAFIVCFLFPVLSLILAPIICVVMVGICGIPFVIIKRVTINKAKKKMLNFKGIVIGITGSYGKSSTKEILAEVLSKKFKVANTEKNDNSEIGVAKTVLQKLKGDEDIFVVEMGAYKKGEIKAICEIVKPSIGIITGIGDQHLELFGSIENLKSAKFELIDSLPKEGLRLVAEEEFSLSQVKNIGVFKDHVEFEFQRKMYYVPILGESLIRNILAVILVAKHLGLNESEISSSLKDLKSKNIYPKLLHGNIVDNGYNNSLESFLSALSYLKVWSGFKKIVVTPGILELGKNNKIDHQIIEKELKFVDKVFVTKEGVFETGEVVSDFRKLTQKIKKIKDDKTVVLFQGRIPRIVIDNV